MIIEQISVFIENKSGRLDEVMSILADHAINVSALSIADTADYGIVRMIVSDPEKATKLLKEQAFVVRITPVICCKTPNKPGGLKKMLSYLKEDGMSIEYMYAFSVGEEASVILKTSDCDKSIASLKAHQMELMKASEIYHL